jgi:hypothetical protein
MTVKIQNKERILKAAKEKHKLTDKPIRIIWDLSAKTLNTMKTWNDIFQILKVNNCQLRLSINVVL